MRQFYKTQLIECKKSNSFKVKSAKRTLKVWQVFDKMMSTLTNNNRSEFGFL